MYRNNISQTDKTLRLVINPKYEELPVPSLSKSSVCESGDKNAAVTPIFGILSIGMNIPLTNIRGILTKLSGTITSPGLAVGIDANRIPIAEYTIDESPIPITSTTGSEIGRPVQIIPMPLARAVIPKPNMNPAIIFPHNIEMSEMGADRNRSKVRILRSIGIATGPMLLADQNTVWADNTGINLSGDMFRPTVNVKNNATGKRIPNISAGGRK